MSTEQPPILEAASFSTGVLNEATVDSLLLAALEQFKDQGTDRLLLFALKEYEDSGTTQKETPAKISTSVNTVHKDVW